MEAERGSPCVAQEDDGTKVYASEHDWLETECRVSLDSRTYRVIGVTYTWTCSNCGDTLTETAPYAGGRLEVVEGYGTT